MPKSVGTGSNDSGSGIALPENELPSQEGNRMVNFAKLQRGTVLDEYRRAKTAIEKEVDRLREAYYDAQRWKEKQDLDGSEVDRRYAREFLIAAYDNWHDSRELLAELARFIKPVWMREMKRQRDEFVEMETMEMV